MEESSEEMSPLEISGDSIKSTNKRQRQLSSEEEILPAKKSRNTEDEELSASNITMTNLITNDPENNSNKEVTQNTNVLNNQKHELSSTNELQNNSSSMESEKEITKESSLQNTKSSITEISDHDSHDTSIKSEITESLLEHTPKKDTKLFKENANINVTTSSTKDTEVVDGLELLVECASDKEESSSESDKNNDSKPRKKTIIIKAKPNESELDVSSSEKEDCSEQNLTDNLPMKKNLKPLKRKKKKSSINIKKTSCSEDSSHSSIEDDDNKPQNKRKTTRNTNKKSFKSVSETKKDRDMQKVKPKKQDKTFNNDDEDDNNDDDRDNDIEQDNSEVNADRINKSVDADHNEKEHSLSDNETSTSGNENDNDDTDKSKDSKKRKHGSTKPDDDKRIQSLKKYIRAAGITVRSYQEIWSRCKTNAARVQQLKSLLEKHGVSGRPTLEKCKKVKQRNENLKEVSELDKSNIISEGRVTRSRRNMDSNKNSIMSPETPLRHREARNTYKRIKTVIDSDSE